jgi:hypothetical protein
MASLAKIYSKEKLLGKVYTPSFVVEKILDDIGYNSPSILGKKIIDPACGDGRFLEEIVRRIFKFSPVAKLKENLECVHGWDIDSSAVADCKANLDKILPSEDINVNWNIQTTNSIEKKTTEADFFMSLAPCEKFDYIVGNPPYIRVQHLDIGQRKYIQENYNFCKSGSTDIYIAFFELCLDLLAEQGVCGLITPNTFLSTETARLLRSHFSRNCNLLQITNYGEIQLFDNATTYSAITIFNKNKNANFKFQKATDKYSFKEKICDISELSEPIWQLSANEKKRISGKKLKEICKIHVGITTLCDNAYIFPFSGADERVVVAKPKLRGTVHEVKIEREILRPIIKGSKLKDEKQQVCEYVLFPYVRVAGKHIIMPEEELRERFPLAYNYLLSVKPELDKRDNGRPNPVSWYAFGRSQGLDTSFGKKIIFSPMNVKPNFVRYEKPDCTFYSGYCIKYDGDTEALLAQLNSERMEEFVNISCRDFRGGWKAYNKKIIENFEVEI